MKTDWVAEVSKKFKKIGHVPVRLACSGGLDSMVLCDLLIRFWPDKRLIAVLTLDHNQRESAKADLELVSKFCKEHQVSWKMKKLALPHKASEALMRKSRYEAFQSELKENELLMTAHHANDQLETFLLKLFRGAHPESIRGIQEHSKRGGMTIVRPLLSVFREQLLEYAKKRKLPWNEDETNQDMKFSRNRLRSTIIPKLDDIHSNAKEHALDFFQTLSLSTQRKHSSAIAAETIDLFRSKDGLPFFRTHFEELKRLIDGLLGDFASSTTKAHWNALKRQMELRAATKKGSGPKKVLQFPGGNVLLFQGNRLFWNPS